MKIIVSLALIAILASLSVVGADMTVVSDSNTKWYDGSTWNPAVPTWVHPAWTANVNLPATWIWETEKVTAEEAVNGGKAEFLVEYEIPKCATDIKAELKITTDNEYEIYFPHLPMFASDGDWQSVEAYDISKYVAPGINQMMIRAYNAPQNGGTWSSNPAGLIYTIDINYDGCKPNEVPEFTVIGATLVLLGAGFVAYKKRK